VQELVDSPLEKLTEIPGIGEKTAEKLLAVAQEYQAAHPPVLPEAVSSELEFTPEMEAAPEPDVDQPGTSQEMLDDPAAAPAGSGMSANAPDPGTPGDAPAAAPAPPNEGVERVD
jgi:hypothetical protein